MSIDASDRHLRGNLNVLKERCNKCNNKKKLVTNNQSKCTKCKHIKRFY